jgi:SrtB family sortase
MGDIDRMSKQSMEERKRERALRNARKRPNAAVRLAELDRCGRNGYVTRYTPAYRAIRTNLASIPDMRILRRKKRLSNAIPNVIIIVCLAFAVTCVLALGMHQETLAKSSDQLEQVAQTVTTTPQTPDETNLPPAVDFAALQKVNGDVAGWIYIPGTVVNYPIMYSQEKEKYLRKDLWGEHATNGSIFADWRNTADLSDEHVVLYGHHLPWEAMFTPVSRYLTDDGFLEKHRTVYIETPTTTYVLSVIGTHKVQPTAVDEVDVQFSNDEAFQKLVDAKLDLDKNGGRDTSDYDRRTIGKMFSLITCADNGKARSITECIPVSEYPTSMVPQVRAAANASQTDATGNKASATDAVKKIGNKKAGKGNSSGSSSSGNTADEGFLATVNGMFEKIVAQLNRLDYSLTTADDN